MAILSAAGRRPTPPAPHVDPKRTRGGFGAGPEPRGGYSIETQRISWPSPTGEKRMPLTFLLNGPNHLVL